MARINISEWITENNLLKLRAWARDGYTDEQIACKIGISRQTLYRWRKKEEEIDKALKKGKEIADIEVENALFSRAVGGYYTESKEEIKTIDGQEIKTTSTRKRYQAPDVTACIWWLKNRKPDTWFDREAKPQGNNQDAAIYRYIDLLEQTIQEEAQN